MSEICKKCAECCKNFPYVDLSIKEINSLEQATGIPFKLFTNSKGKEVEEYFLQFKDNGYCIFLNKNKGSFFCSVYEIRPEICKNYPSKPTQDDACKKNIKKTLLNISGQ